MASTVESFPIRPHVQGRGENQEQLPIHIYSVRDARSIVPLITAELLAEDPHFSMRISSNGESRIVQSGNEKTNNFYASFLEHPVPDLLSRSLGASGEDQVQPDTHPLQELIDRREILEQCKPYDAGRIVATYAENKLFGLQTYMRKNKSLNGAREPLEKQMTMLQIIRSGQRFHGELPFRNREDLEEILIREIKKPTPRPSTE